MSTIERHSISSIYPVDAEHLHRYAIATQLSHGKKVVDIACGLGYGTRMIATQAKHVFGIDIDAQTIEYAKKSYQTSNIDFKQGNLLEIPCENGTIDLVVSFETIEHIEEHQQAMIEIKRILKPDGILLISTPNKLNYSDKSGYKNPYHLKELYAMEFQTLLSNHFKECKLLVQSFYCGSLVSGENIDGPIIVYGGNAEVLLTKTLDQPAMFFIAIASEIPLPKLGHSFFDLTQPIWDNHALEISALSKSYSYRIGNALVRVANWLRFKK